MSVRKRTWVTSRGVTKEAWIVDYTDQGGNRRGKNFARKKDADAFAATTTVEVRDGVHVADSASPTVKEAGALWLTTAEAANPPLERTSLDQYRQHLRLHITPMIGGTRLSQLTAPAVRAFEDRLRAEGRSATLTKYVIRSLGALLADAQERGLVIRNTVRELRGRRRKGADSRRKARGKKLKLGTDIPTPAEVRAIVDAATGRWRPFLMTAALTGLRASELRGLRWSDVNLSKGKLHVQQRADRYRAIGKPKTEAGEREIPLPPRLVSVLREWKLACPKTGDLGLVFPTDAGTIQAHVNIIERGLKPTMIKAGVTVPAKDKSGKLIRDEEGAPIVVAKYTGLHALRHFYVSWCINRKVDGGLELPAKMVQARIGHSSIQVTLDTYGHLFPSGDDGAELADAERALLG